MANKLRGLYAITPESPDGTCLLADVEAALAGGCRLVQYRDKTSAAPERVARAQALRRLTLAHNARLVINDDMALAFLVKADGVHLGREDGNLAAARAILGPTRLLGASCYADFSAAQQAATAGADYVAFGAFFPTDTKDASARAELELLTWWQQMIELPCVAIGGITVNNAKPLVEAGADFLAVSAGVWRAEGGPGAAVAAFNAIFDELAT